MNNFGFSNLNILIYFNTKNQAETSLDILKSWVKGRKKGKNEGRNKSNEKRKQRENKKDKIFELSCL